MHSNVHSACVCILTSATMCNMYIADFGLTEDMYNTNYIRRRKKSETEEKVPIRWMAPESIEDCIYTEATDVVSHFVIDLKVFDFNVFLFSGHME